jgi:ABC-type cobalamin/Fe3+-siderophores transport system ATPase subunit
VAEALARTGTTELSGRPVDELSGGQRQRVWIAMALAQQTDVMLLDEPTTYLDLAHQIEVLDLLAELNRDGGRTIVLVLHDLNQACRYAHHLIAMRSGRIVAEGAPADVISESLVQDVFGLPTRIITDPVSHTPLIVPIGAAHR